MLPPVPGVCCVGPGMRRLVPLLTLLCLACATAPAGARSAPRVVGGHDATHDFPWVAFVTNTGGAFECTGDLIAPTWVLTAGHCSALTELGGPGQPGPLVSVAINDPTPRDGAGGERPAVKQVIPHPQYDGFSTTYDIGLIELAEPVKATPIKVAGPADRALWAPGALTTIAGFGATQADGSGTPETLQEAQVPVISDPDCASHVDNYDATVMLCAGYLGTGGTDTCSGDSGGPIMNQTAAGEWRLVGTTSFGNGCAGPDDPGVYARIGDDALRAFIAEHVPEAIASGTASSQPSQTTSSAPSSSAPAKKHKRARCKTRKQKRTKRCKRLARKHRHHKR